jgi:hypothetical protein
MEVKSTGGEIYSINPLAVYESKRKVVGVLLRSRYRTESLSNISHKGKLSENCQKQFDDWASFEAVMRRVNLKYPIPCLPEASPEGRHKGPSAIAVKAEFALR